jgi:hypothetical protein
MCVLAPLRQTSGDTAAGRIGGLVLRCTGSFDLSRAAVVATLTNESKVLYWMLYDQAEEFSSTFGPAPAVVAAVALPDFGEGDELTDHSLRVRERGAAAVLVALSALLLAIALRARTSVLRATLGGALAAASFAGAATLGQGLWQASVALPPLVGALALLAWRNQRPRLTLAVPALALLAVMIRPTITPLALGIGVAWAVPTRTLRPWLIATGIAVAIAAPFVVWNVIHLWSPFPINQWSGNARETSSVLSPGGFARGLAGLLVSPARGILWFAPITLVGIYCGRQARWLAGGLLLQLALMATFFKWHGGVCFGPRLLAEATWVAIYLAFAYPTRALVERIAAAVTVAIGLLGLARYDPDRWDSRRTPERDASAFWDFADSPITAMVVDHPTRPTNDAPPVRGYQCANGFVRSVP